MYYPIVIHKEPRSSYGVTVPDLPGCFSGGDTLDVAIARASEAVAFHIEGLLLQGEPAPPPQPIAVNQANPDYADGIWVLVAVDLALVSEKSVRVNISMPSRVLAALDTAAQREGSTRSSLLTQAALGLIKGPRYIRDRWEMDWGTH